MNTLNSRAGRIGLAAALVVMLIVGVVTVNTPGAGQRATVVGYFENSNGIYTGDDVVILGVPVGTVEKIEPQPFRSKITFSFDEQYKVPADVKAVILSPALVTARAIQLVPAYSSGPTLQDGAVIPQERTAVPVEFDQFRQQLERLADTLQPTTPGVVRARTSVRLSSSCRMRSRPSATTARVSSAPSRTCRSWCQRCRTAPTCCGS
jgi:phospholipid/cholesterol/gamma-HCH transport system substrate-binding protein